MMSLGRTVLRSIFLYPLDEAFGGAERPCG